ncbi:hypothetical protein [Ruegeria sediminis]|nr:hypothetical protein [Ruegeria sediminis]
MNFGNILTIGGTLGCALGIGYLMQNGASGPASLDSASVDVASASLEVTDVEVTVLTDLRDITLTSSLAPEPEQKGAIDVSKRIPPQLPGPADRANCRVSATATAAPMASADLSVSAPCHKNQRVTVHHSGLAFTETTDPEGRLDITIPALTESAVFVVALDDGNGAVAATRVQDLGAYDRIALQWAGDAGFQIHALEFGASYGEDGHVWADAGASGMGRVTHLGRNDVPASQVAEVYSFPSDKARKSGSVALTLEAEVTASNCGRDISAQSLELRGNSALRLRDLTLAMPDCGETGEFLVLNNLVQDLKIAAK